MNKKCCFTGHRLHKIPWLADPDNILSRMLYDTVRRLVVEKIEMGFDYFISGMALGADMMCARIVLELRNSYPNIKLECALPCEEQALRWGEKERQEYREILAQSDYISVISQHYSRACLHMRNKYMVENSQRIIAIWDGSDGGTQNTVLLANRYHIPVEVVNPQDCVEAIAM